MRLDRIGSRSKVMLLVAVALVALVAAACLPPKPATPPPPPPTTKAPITTTTTKPPVTTTTKPPPPAICGVSASASTASVGAPNADTSTSNRYVAVVKRNGRSKVLTATVNSPTDLARFRADAAAQGEVVSLAPDGEVHATVETPTWGFLDSKFSAAWNEATPSPTTGAGVRVAELDTGIDTAHPDLTGHFDPTPGADFVTNPSNPPADTTDPSSSGHGTHVAGILAATANNSIGVEGGAPGVTLVPVRVLDTKGSGSYSNVAAGILWAADVTKGNAQVITMSLGGGTGDPTVTQAVHDVEDPTNPNYTHPVITIAAGNSSCSTPEFPASLESTFPQVLAVSALCKVSVTGLCPSATPWPADGAFKLATYSSLAWNGAGTPTGITAPGTEIISTLPGGLYGSLSGTSMATPFVAAAAALVVAHCPMSSSYTSSDVVHRLESSAHDLGPSGPDTLYGYGMLDADNAVKAC